MGGQNYRSPTPSAVPLHDDALTEVVDGVVVEKVVGAYSCRLAGRLSTRLGVFVEDNALGMVVVFGLFILDAAGRLRRRPHVGFVSAERWPLDRPLSDVDDWDVAPDLAVEVVSPGDSAASVAVKVVEYFAHAVRQVWVVYPQQKVVHVHDAPDRMRIVREADTLDTLLVPGWSLPLTALFKA